MIDPNTPQRVSDEYEARLADLAAKLAAAEKRADEAERQLATARASVAMIEADARRAKRLEEALQSIESGDAAYFYTPPQHEADCVANIQRFAREALKEAP